MTAPRHIVVIGSGPNELVLACTLAKAGAKVTVLEPSDVLGGIHGLREIPDAPGYRLEVASPAGWVAPKVMRELGLDASTAWPEAGVVAACPGERPLVLWTDLAKSIEEIRHHSISDAEKWASFSDRMTRLAGFLEALYAAPPPRVLGGQAGDLFGLLSLGLRLRQLGKVDMIELLRTLPMSVQDLLDDWFDNRLLKATIGAGGVTNILQGPRSAGTAFVLLHHLVGRPNGAFRAVRRASGPERDALARLAEERGVELRPHVGAGIRILVDAGRVTGVALPSGEELPARYVVSGADPRTTLLTLVRPSNLEPEVVHAAGHVKLRGARAVVHLALGERPRIDGVPDAALGGVISLAGDLDDLERAYDDAKHRRTSQSLVVEATIPSIADPSLAPPGKHVISVAVQYVRYGAKDVAWDDAARRDLADRAVRRLGEVMPNLTGAIVGRAVYGPRDIEATFGLGEGHLYGGELTLDQILFMRPLPGLAHYRTPIEGLFLCGEGCHPGGALPGLAGRHAAREIAKET